jgi:hypothetical protein
VAVAGEARLDERVERAVDSAVAARRVELERLVRLRVDAVLAELAVELVEEQLRANGAGVDQAAAEAARRPRARPSPPLAASEPLCSECGERQRLRYRRVCRECDRASRRARYHARRAEAAGSAAGPSADAEPDRPDVGAGLRDEPADQGGDGSIGVDELARRSCVNGRGVEPRELLKWLTAAGFATGDEGALRPTAAALALGTFLEPKAA